MDSKGEYPPEGFYSVLLNKVLHFALPSLTVTPSLSLWEYSTAEGG